MGKTRSASDAGSTPAASTGSKGLQIRTAQIVRICICRQESNAMRPSAGPVVIGPDGHPRGLPHTSGATCGRRYPGARISAGPSRGLDPPSRRGRRRRVHRRADDQRGLCPRPSTATATRSASPLKSGPWVTRTSTRAGSTSGPAISSSAARVTRPSCRTRVSAAPAPFASRTALATFALRPAGPIVCGTERCWRRREPWGSPRPDLARRPIMPRP